MFLEVYIPKATTHISSETKKKQKVQNNKKERHSRRIDTDISRARPRPHPRSPQEGIDQIDPNRFCPSLSLNDFDAPDHVNQMDAKPNNPHQRPPPNDWEIPIVANHPNKHPGDVDRARGNDDSSACIIFLICFVAVILVLALCFSIGLFVGTFFVAIVPCFSVTCRRRTLRAIKGCHRKYPLCGMNTDKVSLTQAIKKYENGLASPKVG